MAAYALLDGVPVIEARLSLPRLGVWTADLRVDAESLAKGRRTLSLGGVPFSGTVVLASSWRGSVNVRMQAGAAGMGRQLPAKAYRGAPVRVALADIAREAGEQLDASLDSEVVLAELPHWVRHACPAGTALASLMAASPGAVWRFLPSGALWVGRESWPASGAVLEGLGYSPLEERLETFSLSPSVLPGQAARGRRVSYVEHRIGEQRVATTLWFEKEA